VKFIVIAIILLLIAGVLVLAMRRRPAPPLTLLPPPPPALVAELRRDVATLCAVGERSTFVPGSLQKAADLIANELTAAGLTVERHTYRVEQDGVDVDNVIAEIKGATKANEIIVIGAHYDSVTGTTGADDNASGVAAVLALARRFAHAKPARTLRFVAFANEEPPHFQTKDMGSWQYAKRCHDRGERIAGMLSLETIGYFDERPGSQHYPAPLASFFPDTGNFIAFASNLGSRGLNAHCVLAFKSRTKFPVESASVPELVQEIGWSDHWSFWQFGYAAAIVTDTAPFRNPHYHEDTDLPPTLDYERMAHVVEGLTGVVEELVRG
jgi:hypothetical protein